MATGGNEIDTDAVPFISSDTEIFQLEDYTHLMGSDLKLNNFEILLISHEDDYSLAKKLQDLLMKNVTYSFGDKKVKPKVELHRELVYASDAATSELDLSLQKALIVLVLATKSLSKDSWPSFEARVALDTSFNKEKEYKQSVFVVHTKPEGERDYNLLKTINSVKSLYFSGNDSEDGRFYDRVGIILQSKANIQNEKDRKLYFERLQFLKNKKPNVYAKLTNRRSYEYPTHVNEHQQAIGQCSRNISQCSVGNNFLVPASMVPCDPNGDTQVDADTDKENPVHNENFELENTVINPSESDSSFSSDSESVGEETFPKVVMQSPPVTVAMPEEEGDDLGADNGALPGTQEEMSQIVFRLTGL